MAEQHPSRLFVERLTVGRLIGERASRKQTRSGALATQVRVNHRSPRTPEQLGARIRKVRMELGLSLAGVAQKDFSRSFLNQVELGRARPSTRTLQIIAERL